MISVKNKKKFLSSQVIITGINFILNQILFNILIYFLNSNISAIITLTFSSVFGIFANILSYNLKTELNFILKFIALIILMRFYDYYLFIYLQMLLKLNVSVVWFLTLLISYFTKIIIYYLFFKKNINNKNNYEN
jgi:hypothetical protein